MRIAAGLAIFLAGFSSQAVGGAAEPPAAARRIFDDYGTFTTATRDDHGVVRVGLWDDYVRYTVPRQPDDRARALVFLLNQANDGSRAVALRYDATRGRLNGGMLEYPLCSIALDSLRFEPAQSCGREAPAPPRDFEAALALARAHMWAGDLEEARALLTRFGPPSEANAKKLYLRVRAENQIGLAAARPMRSREADEALAGALADYRALAALDPDDVEHQFDIAGALLGLGAYAEARAKYDAILKRWPNEEYRVAVRIGALYREQGDYEKALQSLNDLVARSGPQDGMKFHYHRGWTLSLLGRYDEAIREYSDGMKSQPDYASAYERRACAYASVGQLREALRDADEAARLVAATPGAERIKPLRDEAESLAALRDQLRAALAQGDGKPLSGTCSGPTWRSFEHPRPRSALLPPA